MFSTSVDSLVTSRSASCFSLRACTRSCFCWFSWRFVSAMRCCREFVNSVCCKSFKESCWIISFSSCLLDPISAVVPGPASPAVVGGTVVAAVVATDAGISGLTIFDISLFLQHPLCVIRPLTIPVLSHTFVSSFLNMFV